MKKMIGLCVLGGLMAASATAQIKKGTVLLGGQIGGSSDKTEVTGNPASPDNIRNTGNFGISGGIAIKENKVFGVYGNYGASKYSYDPNVVYQNIRYRTYSAGIFYRQYKSLAKNFYIFGEANIGYIGSSETMNDNVSTPTILTLKTNGVSLGFTPGASYQVCKKLQIELLIPSLLNINYQTRKGTYNNRTDAIKTTSFNANAATQSGFLNNVAIGFKFTL